METDFSCGSFITASSSLSRNQLEHILFGFFLLFLWPRDRHRTDALWCLLPYPRVWLWGHLTQEGKFGGTSFSERADLFPAGSCTSNVRESELLFGYVWHEGRESPLCSATGSVVLQRLILNPVRERGTSCDPSLPQFLYKTVSEAAKTVTVFKEQPSDETLTGRDAISSVR